MAKAAPPVNDPLNDRPEECRRVLREQFCCLTKSTITLIN